jgi:hypothetical protein
MRFPRLAARVGDLLQPQDDRDLASPGWQELERKFQWFHNVAVHNQFEYYVLKLLTISAGALVPFFVAGHRAPFLAGLAGVTVVVSEGIEQLLRTHENWIRYRSTAEALRREGFDFVARIRGYRSA